MTPEEVLVVLDAGEFDRFIGVEESLQLEFKGSPYRLDDEAGKFELAKDTSALANAQGGVIVIGVRTERHPERFADTAASLRQVPRELVDESRYRDVISERVYPRIAELDVRFYSPSGSEERGLLAITVPPQDELDKYFLVQRPIGEDERLPGWLVGLAVRSFARIDEHRVGELHALINRGRSISRQLDDIAASVASLHRVVGESEAGRVTTDSPAGRLSELVDRRLREITGG